VSKYQLKEFKLYISNLTLRRALNLILCGLGFAFSKVLRVPIVWGMPNSVSIETTNRCNLACPECPSGLGILKRPIGNMSFDNFKKIIDNVYPYATTALLHFQGEPLLNANISKMIEYASSKRLITEISSNAMLINESRASEIVRGGLKKLVVTIDSPLSKEFGFYRKGGSLEKIINGINNIQRAKQQQQTMYPLIVLEMLMFNRNTDNINNFIELAKSLYVDEIRLKSAQILTGNEGYKSVPTGTKFSRYKLLNDGTYAIRAKQVNSCTNPWFMLSITQDGWIVPCCFDKSAFYILGSINYQSVLSAWRSPIYNLFRKRILTHRSHLPICKDCPQDRVKLDFSVS
jgi:MoaA/NifB/PqqE/SkfB family radical SAM enzyme